MIQIIPAILATTEEEYLKFIDKINSSNMNGIDWIHIDFMDNIFVQNQSIRPEIITKYPVNSKLEAHLMVREPLSWVEELIRIGMERVIIPVEIHFQEIDRILDMVQDLNIEIGLSLNPETEVSKIEPYLDKLDVVLIMAVHPGFQGQEFIQETLRRIKEISHIRSKNNFGFLIEVDGGISEENVRDVAEAGADIAIVGSGLFKYDNLEVGLGKIHRALYG